MLRQTMILTETILKIQVAYTPQIFPSQLNTVNEMPGTDQQPPLPALWLANVKGTLRSATIFVFFDRPALEKIAISASSPLSLRKP